jgi:hypothetical protein
MFDVMTARCDRRPRTTGTGAAAVAWLGLLIAGLSACGNWISVTDAGRIGITVDAAGNPVIAVMTCGESLGEPGDNWVTVRRPGALETDKLFVVDGGTVEDEHASLGAVSFRTADVARLSPGQVQVPGKVESLSTFGAYRCH